MRRLSFALILSCAIGVCVSAPASAQYYGPSVGAQPLGLAWRGLYGGVHLGGTWGSTQAYDSGGINTLDDYWSAAPSGVVAGGQLGYNWVNGPVLYGVEGDIGYLGLAGSATTAYVPFGYDSSTQTDLNFYLTLRGRLGIVVDSWLFYATGGYIGADTTVSIIEGCDSVLCGGPFVVDASKSGFRSGWTLGGGLEGELAPRWTAKVEYLYYDLGSVNVTTTAGGVSSNWTLDTTGSLVRAGLNYRFSMPNF
jgi:outer membrane immunogenic protein